MRAAPGGGQESGQESGQELGSGSCSSLEFSLCGTRRQKRSFSRSMSGSKS